MSNWTISNIPDQTGRIVIVTGANSGIGFEAAKALAEKNAEVIFAVRNLDKGNAAVTQIQTENPEANVSLRLLDLANLDSVKTFADQFKADHTKLDLLINNAGIMVPPYSKTIDGFESQMGTNHFGHFALTAQLYPLLEATTGSRIVNVSSNAHKMGNLNVDDLHWDHRKYAPWKAYGDSKIANLYFTHELTRRLETAGSDVQVTAAHPGWASTGLQKSLLLRVLNVFFSQSGFMGALPTLRAAIQPEVNSGDYFGPSGIGEVRGYPKLVKSNKLSHDPEIAANLWSVSENMTSEKFNI